ncbi:YihY/virulence factor BrkB family protein [Calothrix sp. PCC 6303]|uniref:YihY/virulence factor BrkB family protein n=1 Tax=Calothrix sp. PCC 6303 TaxID=1170562 RepID=UPI0002A03704|nr:YihY/virulence factor BrkB family protein [Calothrix sp. PCC 6303]AFZ02813.1 ribonuclease BN [Calothrix sp. PCC 6303]
MRFKAILELFQETFSEWSKDKVSRLAAALSYYTIFSIAPLLIIVIAIAGAVFGEDAARGAIENQLQGLIGDGAAVIQTAIKNADKPQQGTIASLVSLVVLVFGATGLFAELQDSLNTIWEVQPKPGRAVKTIIRQRFLSFTLVFGIGFLLLVSLVMSAILAALIGYFQNILPGIDIVWQMVNILLVFAVTTALFALIFKVLPDVKIAWADVWIGATLTSLLFSLGRFILGQYLGRASFSSTYGAAGSIVVILVWVNYAAQILFFGAEFTQVYARKYGSQIVPDKNAIPLTESARVEQGMNPNREQRIGRSRRKKQGLFSWLNRSASKSKRK